MRRRLAAVFSALALLAVGGAAPGAASGAGWHSEQPLSAGSAVPVALGKVYDIEFWAPNRGLLITANGLWAYDGSGWQQLSTVCGGTGGRIAWAGPLDFWTISDQPVGQAQVDPSAAQHRSLCHFVNGAVVASYAQPVGMAESFAPMNAAACLAPDDCWFAGERLSGEVNTGAFHLHWDGHGLTPVPSLTEHDPTIADPDRAVAGLAVHQGALYESVRVDGDEVPGEPNDQPYLLHEVFPGTPPAFVPLFPASPIDYGGEPPSMLSPLQLSSDGSTLWAAAGTSDWNHPTPASVLRLGPDGFAQLALNDPANLLAPQTKITAIAAEPGTDAAWVGLWPAADNSLGTALPARLTRVHADGTVDPETVLPSAADGIARKQPADRLACPGQEQCWMSTQAGWLFHLGGNLPRDEEPAMHELITYRPPDASTPILPLDTLPDEEASAKLPPEETTPRSPKNHHRRARPRNLVGGVRQRMIRGSVLELRFTLAAKARVQLVAKRGKKTVARTKRATLDKGKHVLRLRLDAKRWPTKLDLRAKRVKR